MVFIIDFTYLYTLSDTYMNWVEITKGVSNFNLSDIDILYRRGWSEIHVTLLMTKIKWGSEIKWCHIWHNNRILMQLK